MGIQLFANLFLRSERRQLPQVQISNNPIKLQLLQLEAQKASFYIFSGSIGILCLIILIRFIIFQKSLTQMSLAEEDSLRESLLTTDQQINNNKNSPENAPDQEQKQYNSKVINGDSIFQKIFFTWIYSTLKIGWNNTIKVEGMPSLTNKLKTQTEFNKLKRNFNETTVYKRQGLTLSKALFKTYYSDFLVILSTLWITVGLSMFSPFLTSMIMKYIDKDQSDKDISQGQMLFFVTLIATFMKNLSQTHTWYRFTQMGINMTNSLTMLIYNKSLRYASLSEKAFTESEIVNYSQVDAQRMTYMGYQLAALLTVPFQIIIGVIMMYYFIGISFASGFGAMVFMIFCTYFVNKKSVKYNEQVLKVKDQRMKVTQQMLDIIRYIKINAIQKFFFKKINNKRMNQIDLYKKKGFMDVLNIFIYWLACPVILSVTFLTYVMMGNQMTSQVAFTTIMIFSILQYPIRLLPNCISEVIQIYASIKRIEKYLLAVQMKNDHMKQVFEQDSEIAVKIERGDFYWGLENKKKDQKDEKNEDNEQNKQKNKNKKKSKKLKQKVNEVQSLPQTSSVVSESGEESENQLKQSKIYTLQQINNQPIDESIKQEQRPKYVHALKDINTTIQKSKMTILIGDIGSGKTSLLLAILNEMRCSNQTRIQINGSIAYASQKPWIMSGTVRDNIVFTCPYDQIKFNRVIHYASLEHDIKILPKGIETEIGEKGVNLSGGQKTRISLARALYSNQDIYLLDDILSAVDVHVGQFLMKQTLLGYLKGKTIIMPTHAVKFAQLVDEVIIMKKGRIARKGHYRDICDTPQFKEIAIKQQKKQQKKQKKEQNDKELESQFAMMKDALQHKSQSRSKNQVKAVEDIIVEQLMLPEDQVVGKVDFKIFRQYIELNGGIFRFAVLVSLAMFFWIASLTAASIIIERWCEDPEADQDYLYIYIALSILSNIFIFFRAYTLVLSGAKQGEKVHKSMMKSLLYASLGNFYNRIPIGRIINRLTKDLRQLDEEIGFAIGNVLVNFFSLLSTLTICIYSSTPLIFIPIIIVMFLSNKIRVYYLKTQREVSRLQKTTNSPIVTGFISAISGLSTIRAYHKQQTFLQNQMTFIDINKKVRLNKSALESWFSLTLTYLSFLVNMTAVGYCILSNNDNPSLAGLLMNYAINLSSDIIYFIMSIANFETKIVSLQRIYNFMKINPQPAYQQYCLEWTQEEQGYKKVIGSGRIQFIDTNVKYRKDLPLVLKGLNCSINQGQKIGIVGRTGAGKTTIINTLLRITEIDSGDVLIDGRSIKSLPLKDMRNDITMIDQEPTLIKSTFQQNLDITGRYTEEELLNILKECNLYQTIIQKGGLQGKVSNDSLSVGEKQLLCICRAFLKQSKVVLIDEATANIDLKNDEIIQRVIQEKFRDCTVLTIAHRLSTLKNSDKILVMENGRILEFGSPQELQEKPNGFYRDMIKKKAEQLLS